MTRCESRAISSGRLSGSSVMTNTGMPNFVALHRSMMSRSSAMTTTEDTSTKSVERASTISRSVGNMCSLARSLTATLNIVVTSSRPAGRPLLLPRRDPRTRRGQPLFSPQDPAARPSTGGPSGGSMLSRLYAGTQDGASVRTPPPIPIPIRRGRRSSGSRTGPAAAAREPGANDARTDRSRCTPHRPACLEAQQIGWCYPRVLRYVPSSPASLPTERCF